MSRSCHVIGLTGQSGAGKTTVSKVFAENGFSVIDADIISREVMKSGSPCLDELAEVFGKDIILPDGSLDRKKMGSIVFSDRHKLELLDKICYPYIVCRINERIAQLSDGGSRFILLDAPTLFEAGADRLCEKIISVTADEDIRLKRIMERDGLPSEAVKNRFSSQHSEEFFEAHSDYIIKNNQTNDILADRATETASRIKEYYR